MKRLGIFLLLLGPALASPEQSLQKGDQVAQELLGKLTSQTNGHHPFYQGISVADTNPSLAAQFVKEASTMRPHFKIDPGCDPLLSRAEHITSNALIFIGGKGTTTIQSTQGTYDEITTCEESGEDEELVCRKTLTVPVRKTVIQKEWHGWFHTGEYFSKEKV